jgi:site-specific DNA-methyltransferase (adenine-specific)
MDGQLADMLLTDPPYNVAYEGGSKIRDKIKNDKMEDNEFRQFLRDAFLSADMYMKRGAVFYIWHADLEAYNFRGAVNDVEWQVRQSLIWNKDNSAFGRSDYHWKHEPCLYGWKSGSSHLWASDRKQVTVLDFARPSNSKLHPTMKPVDLLAYQLTNNTKGSDLVLDLFLGSGSTLIAAEKTNRKCYGMELDPKYCDVIIQRWEEFTGNKAELSNG